MKRLPPAIAILAVATHGCHGTANHTTPDGSHNSAPNDVGNVTTIPDASRTPMHDTA